MQWEGNFFIWSPKCPLAKSVYYFELWWFVLELVYFICWDRDDWSVRGAAGVSKAERVRRERERERRCLSVCLALLRCALFAPGCLALTVKVVSVLVVHCSRTWAHSFVFMFSLKDICFGHREWAWNLIISPLLTAFRSLRSAFDSFGYNPYWA